MNRKLIATQDALSLLPKEGVVHTLTAGVGIGVPVEVEALIAHIQAHEAWLDMEGAPLADHVLVIRKDGRDTYIDVDMEPALSIWYRQTASEHLCRIQCNAHGAMSYQQLFELIERMPAEHRADTVTVFDCLAGECMPIRGFGPIERQDPTRSMLSVLDSGHPVITI